MNHMSDGNIALMISRQSNSCDWGNIFAFKGIVDHCLVSNITSEIGSAFPLWVHLPNRPADLLSVATESRTANFSEAFTSEVANLLSGEPTPEDLMGWIYAVLSSPTYRLRYGDFLRRDYPRVPLPNCPKLFKMLADKGRELIALHVMDTVLPRITTFDVPGDNTVDKVRWAPDAEGATGRVYINAEQCFGKVPAAVWDMHIGGYRVAEKWLKDRKGRPLTYDDLTHYQSVIAALARTLELQESIDAAIDDAGGWPLT